MQKIIHTIFNHYKKEPFLESTRFFFFPFPPQIIEKIVQFSWFNSTNFSLTNRSLFHYSFNPFTSVRIFQQYTHCLLHLKIHPSMLHQTTHS